MEQYQFPRFHPRPAQRPRQRRLDVAAGARSDPRYVNVDMRRISGIDAVCDIRRLPFADHSIDEILALAILEHFQNPYDVLDEFQRVITPDASVSIHVPALGTYAAHLDLDHKFLADLRMWDDILKGYYERMVVKPEGVKYRYNKLLIAILYVLVYGFGFYELAHTWSFYCTKPRAKPTRAYTPWWIEATLDRPAR